MWLLVPPSWGILGIRVIMHWTTNVPRHKAGRPSNVYQCSTRSWQLNATRHPASRNFQVKWTKACRARLHNKSHNLYAKQISPRKLEFPQVTSSKGVEQCLHWFCMFEGRLHIGTLMPLNLAWCSHEVRHGRRRFIAAVCRVASFFSTVRFTTCRKEPNYFGESCLLKDPSKQE